jgi:phospho-N-acetylmuramoyl-pentapeptide-transferase
MLYNLLYPLSVDYSVLNIFKYITFRSAWALVTALAVSILVGPYFIRWLQAIKCRQQILKEVKAHQCKAGTPTMGGLLIVFAVAVSVLLWADLTNAYLWMTMLVFVGFSAVGFVDDFMKVSHHQNKGLSPRAKFAGQMLVAGAAMLLLVSEPAYSTRLAFPFFKTLNPDLGYWYIPFAMLVMVGTSNAVNLTDGPRHRADGGRGPRVFGLHLHHGACAFRAVPPA